MANKSNTIKRRTENQEQIELARLLDAAEICWFHVPNQSYNGSLQAVRHGHHLKQMGRKAGVPDIIILDPPPDSRYPHVGVALEMKRVGGSKPEPHQTEWLKKFDSRSWGTYVAYGCADAVQILRGFGYAL